MKNGNGKSGKNGKVGRGHGARPKHYKFDTIKKEAYFEALKNGLGRMAAARSVDMTPEWMEKLMRRDPEFKKAISRAELEANQKVENALFKAASSGNVVACQVWLYNRMPERWADRRRMEHVGGDKDLPIHGEVKLVIDDNIVREAVGILRDAGALQHIT